MVAAHPTERHEARPENIGLAQPHHFTEQNALTRPEDNRIYHTAMARNDMQELSTKHGFPHNDHILTSAEHPKGRGQHSESTKGASEAPAPTTETTHKTEKSQEVVGYHRVASVMGNDQATVADKQTDVSTDTKVASAAPSDGRAGGQPTSFEPPVATVEPGRPSAPIEQASLQTQNPFPARNEMG